MYGFQSMLGGGGATKGWLMMSQEHVTCKEEGKKSNYCRQSITMVQKKRAKGSHLLQYEIRHIRHVLVYQHSSKAAQVSTVRDVGAKELQLESVSNGEFPNPQRPSVYRSNIAGLIGI